MTQLSRTILPLIAGIAFCTATSAQPLKVYILAGQSNMQGHAKASTLDYLADDPKTQPLLAKLRGADGAPVVCQDVWISYLTGGRNGDATVHGPLTAGFGARRNPTESDDKIGPEFTFGVRMAEAHDGPVLLIKTAWGGKSLNTDFRSPSAGAYEFSASQLEQFKKKGKDVEQMKADRAERTGRYYRSMIAHVREVLADVAKVVPGYDQAQGYDLAGFVWFQGWNDMVDRGTYPTREQPGGYAQYSECMAHFIRDVRKDLQAPELPFVIGVMGVGGPIKEGENRQVHQNFRDAMAQPASLPEFNGNVAAVQTAPFWDAKLQDISTKLGKVNQMSRMLRTKNKRGPNADGSMTREQQKAYMQKYRAEVLTPDEESTWKRGASNAAYHYLGCAKTMTRIGVAFAEAALAMQK